MSLRVIVVLTPAALRLMDKSSSRFLALVRNVEAKVPSLDQVPMAMEFPDVFPNKLPIIPPEKEIEFCVYLIPNTQPRSIPPYYIGPVELRELKEQLQDLLDRGFIHPSTSS